MVLIDVASGSVRKGTAPGNPLRCLMWSGASRIALARAGSPLGDGAGSPGRLFLLDPARASERTLLFTSGLFPLAGTDSRSGSCDALGPGRLVFDQVEWRLNLSEVALTRVLARRQPHRLLVQPQRQPGPLDPGDAHRCPAPAHRRPGPGLGPGLHARWQARALELGPLGPPRDLDGRLRRQRHAPGHARRGRRRESNRHAYGRFIVYTSGHPQKARYLAHRPDGTDDQPIAAGGLLSETGPQGRYTLFVTNGSGGQRLIRVAEVETGKARPVRNRGDVAA